MRIESICDCCSTFFQSHSALYRYIKSRYNALGKITIAEMGSNLSFVKPVFCSTAKLSASGLGLTFRDWSYTTTLITFDLAILPSIGNSHTFVYLNIGCGVSLVDNIWLAKKHLSQKINTMLVPLKVRGIGASRHKLEVFAPTAFYVPGFDWGGSKIYAYI